MTDYKVLCARLCGAIAAIDNKPRALDDAYAEAVAALAEPGAEGPSELEAIELALWDKYRTKGWGGAEFMYDSDFSYALKEYRAALDRWGRPTPQPVAIPGEKYHEDMGPVTWWRLPVDEPPWVGTPNDSDWPGYHTHFTPAPTNPLNANALPLPTPEATDV